MNVLFLSELFYPHGGGAELATYLYAKLLAEAKINVVVVTNRFQGEPDYSDNDGFRVYRLPLFSRAENVKYAILKRSDVLFSSFMRRLMRWADVVYVPRFWFSAIPMTKAMGKPVITHLHDYIAACPLAVLYDSRADRVCEKGVFCPVDCVYAYESSRRRGLVRAVGSTLLNFSVWPVLRKFIEQSDVIICVSKAQRDLIARRAPSFSGKVEVIYNPLPSLSPVPINGDDFGYFGGPSYLKGFHVLLKALEYRKLQGLVSITVHAAKFSGFDKRFNISMGEKGVILYGKLRNNEMNRVYKKVKAVIVPSVLEEPFGYVVVEALLRGRAVIASRIGGIPEILEGCKGVFLFDPGDATELAEEIEKVTGLNKEKLSELMICNEKILQGRFNNHMIIKHFYEICDSVIKAR